MVASIVLALALQAGAQSPIEPAEAAPAVESEPAAAPASRAIVIPRDTPVHLMVLNEVSTKEHAAGHRFRLRVDKPVVVDGTEVIPVGTTAWGELLEAESSGNVGKGGSLTAELRYLELGERRIAIEGGTSADGKSAKGETFLGVLALGPLGLFAKGNNAKIKAGERMTAFIAEDVRLDDAR